MAEVRFTEEEPVPVLRRTISSLPVRLLPDERTTLEEDDTPERLVTTRTEELRSTPLSARRVAPLFPVRDEDDAFAEACLSESAPCRRVEASAEVRWLG